MRSRIQKIITISCLLSVGAGCALEASEGISGVEAAARFDREATVEDALRVAETCRAEADKGTDERALRVLSQVTEALRRSVEPRIELEERVDTDRIETDRIETERVEVSSTSAAGGTLFYFDLAGHEATGAILQRGNDTDAEALLVQLDAETGLMCSRGFSPPGRRAQDAQDFQLEVFALRTAVNSQSQTNNRVSNMQKARHDAMMATVRNTR